MDLVKRLRKFGDDLSVERFTVRETSLEAAAEIERLRAEADENRKLAFFAAQALGSMDTPERWEADKHLMAIIYSGGPQRP